MKVFLDVGGVPREEYIRDYDSRQKIVCKVRRESISLSKKERKERK